MSKQVVPYGVGRRTGKNLLAGKTIRKLSNGMDNFDDYWSSSSSDEDSILRRLAEDTPVMNPPIAKLSATLRSMTSFSESSRGTSMEALTTSPKNAPLNPQIIKSPQTAGPTLRERKVVTTSSRGATSNVNATKTGVSMLGTSKLGTSGQSGINLGLTLNKAGDDSGTISRNETMRSRVGSIPSPAPSFRTKKRLRYSDGSESSVESTPTTFNTEPITFARPVALAPKRSRSSRKQTSVKSPKNPSMEQIPTEPSKTQSEIKTSATIASRKLSTKQKFTKENVGGTNSAIVETEAGGNKNEASADVHRAAADVSKAITYGNSTAAEHKEATAEESEAVVEENEITVDEKDEATAEKSEVTADENEVIAEENEATAEENETTADENEAIAEETEETAEESTLERNEETTEDTLSDNKKTRNKSVLAEEETRVAVEVGEVSAAHEETMDENESYVEESKASALENTSTMDEEEGTVTGSEEVMNGNGAALDESEVNVTTMHKEDANTQGDEANKIEATADKGKATTNDTQAVRDKTNQNVEIEVLSDAIELADDVSESSTIAFISLNVAGHSKSMSLYGPVKNIATNGIDRLDSESDDYEVISEPLRLKNRFCNSRSKNNTTVQKSLNTTSRKAQKKKKETRAILSNKSLNVKPISETSDFEDYVQIQINQVKSQPAKKSKKNKALQEDPNEQVLDEETGIKVPGKRNKIQIKKTGKGAKSGKANEMVSGLDQEPVRARQPLKGRRNSSKSLKITNHEQENASDLDLAETLLKRKKPKQKLSAPLSKETNKAKRLKQNLLKDLVEVKKGRGRGRPALSKSIDLGNDKHIVSDEELSEGPVKCKKTHQKGQEGLSKTTEKSSDCQMGDLPVKPGKGKKGQHSSIYAIGSDQMMKNPVEEKKPQQRRCSSSHDTNTDQELPEEPVKATTRPKRQQKGKHVTSQANSKSPSKSLVKEPIRKPNKRHQKAKLMTLKGKNSRRKVNRKRGKLTSSHLSITSPTQVAVEEPVNIKKRQGRGKCASLKLSVNKNSDIENVLFHDMSEKPLPGRKGKQRGRCASSQPNSKSPVHSLVEDPIETMKKGQQKGKLISSNAYVSSREKSKDSVQGMTGKRASSQPKIKSPTHIMEEDPMIVNKTRQQTVKHALSKSFEHRYSNTENVSSLRGLLEKSLKEKKAKQRGRSASPQSNIKYLSLVEEPSQKLLKKGNCAAPISSDDSSEKTERKVSRSLIQQKKNHSQSQSESITEKDQPSTDQLSQRPLTEVERKSLASDRRSLRAYIMSTCDTTNDSDMDEDAHGSVPPIVADMTDTSMIDIRDASGEEDAKDDQSNSQSRKKNIVRRKPLPSKRVQSAAATKSDNIKDASLHVNTESERSARNSNSDVGDELSPPVVKRPRGRKAQRLSFTPAHTAPSSATGLTSCTAPRKSILRLEGTPRGSHGIAHFSDNLPHYSVPKSCGGLNITRLPRYSTASPMHITEITCSQPIIQHVAREEQNAKIVRPVSDDEGVRRSKRTRVRPLDWHKNERIIYKLDSSGFMAVAGIDLGDDEEPSKEKKLKQLVKKKQQKMKAPRTPRRLSMHHSFTEDVPAITTTAIPVVDLQTRKEVPIDCIRSADTLLFRGPHGGRPYDEDRFIMAKALVQKEFSAGKLLIRPSGEKQRQLVTTDSMVFYIIHGRLGVTVHETTTILESGDFFFVPQGNTYSIKNLRHEEAKLSFFQHKH